MHGFQTRGNFVQAGILVPSGRFGRLFPSLDVREPTGQILAEQMGAKGGPMDSGALPNEHSHDNQVLPAGFTFLAQFLDHDLDFDPTSSIERQTDPNAITNFRTPSLDLDNVYGAGPNASPYLYDNSTPDVEKLLLDSINPDLARNAQNKALIGDPRNDENMLVSQMQRAFIKAHNAIVDGLKAGTYRNVFGDLVTTNTDVSGGESTVFLAAQQLLRWHYQWIVTHEYLPLICGTSVVEETLKHGPRYFNPAPGKEPFMPVEFAVAAYRWGHATIRPFYDLNASNTSVALFPTNPGAPAPTAAARSDLRSGPVGPNYKIDWSRFFERNPSSPPQKAKRFEPLLNTLLLDLPNGVIPSNVPAAERSLATRNLRRSEALELPSGQDVARAMGVDALSAADLRAAAANAGAPAQIPLTDAQLNQCYLWYYVLAEAYHQTNGTHLGDVGGRIVAEVFVGCLDADTLTYRLMYPKWKPTLPSASSGTFKIADLLNIAGV
jgi:hypothetical protein